MSNIKEKLKKGQNLSFEESKILFSELMEGKHDERSIIDILENTNIIIFSGGLENSYCNKNKLILYDDNKRENIGDIKCESNILNINITKKYIIITLIDKCLIYDYKLNLVSYILTGTNIHGLISIYYNDDLLRYSLIGNEKV